MKYILLFILFLVGVTSINPLYAQRKKRIKPVYYGKIQGGYIVDKFLPKGYVGFNYFNLGLRKVTGKKVREFGLETFFYQKTHDLKIINEFYRTGYQQVGFGLNYYQYLMFQKWNFGKLNIQTGPQFSLGFYFNKKKPVAAHNVPVIVSDYKLGGSAKLELNYKIDERYSLILGAQYTVFQFGLRRITTENPSLLARQRLEDFVQFDFLVPRYVAYFGMLTRFGKVKIDRAKIKRKREAEKQRQRAKIAKKKEKREKQIQRKRAKIAKKKN